MANPKASKPSRRGKGRGRRVLAFLAALLAVPLVLLLLMLGRWALQQRNKEVPLAARAEGMVPAGRGAEAALSSPRGLAAAPGGDIYVADLGHARVAVYGKDRAFKFAFGKARPKDKPKEKARPDEFSEPSSVAVAPDGTVYVADAWNGRVAKFDARGRFKAEYGGASYNFYSPRNVAVDARGTLYVADTGNSQVKAISPEGKLLKAIGGKGSGEGAFNEVFGVAVNSKGEIFAADAGNRRIQKFSPLPEAKFLGERSVPGWELNAPFWPMLACDREDRVYAVDSANKKIWVYDAGLKYLASLGAGQAVFTGPLGLAFSPDGQLWVSEPQSNRLLKLAPFSLPSSAAPAAK